VSFFAASGDTGGIHDYPAMSPNVVSVGGTVLTLNGSGDYGGETGVNFSGGGISTQESQPSYQNGVQSSGFREGPDVSIMAGPVNVYDTYPSGGNLSLSGTSVSTPIWAGIVSIVDQQVSLWGYDTLDGRTKLLPSLYDMAVLNNYPNYDGRDFHDIMTGTAGGNQAGLGYDLVTGLGTPIANTLVAELSLYATRRIPTRGGLGTPVPVSAGTILGPQAHTVAESGGDSVSLLVTATQPSAGTLTPAALVSNAVASRADQPASVAAIDARSPLELAFRARLAHSDPDAGDSEVRAEVPSGTEGLRPDQSAPPGQDAPMGMEPGASGGLSGSAASSLVSGEEITDACFAGVGGLDTGPADQVSALRGMIDPTQAPDPLAMAAGVALVMGSVWAPRFEDREQARQQHLRAWTRA
jgi:hypothetical protein